MSVHDALEPVFTMGRRTHFGRSGDTARLRIAAPHHGQTDRDSVDGRD
jgi:hypothetical protein